MNAAVCCIASAIAALLLSSASAFAQAQSQQQQPEFVRKGQQLIRKGKPREALTLYGQTLQTSPDSMPANIAAGSVLDLMGKGEEARKYFAKAIEVASTSEAKASAQRALAMSYAFEGNGDKAVRYEQQVFDFYSTAKNFFQAGEAADEAARVCVDSGDLETAYKWYKTGHDTGLQEADIKPARQDLWHFRWEHAQARIAARRGNQAEAQKHVAAAKAILDKGTNPEQAQFFPYLRGYVAFYSGDYKTALAELMLANQNDPFIQCMLGQTYEKLGDGPSRLCGVQPKKARDEEAEMKIVGCDLHAKQQTIALVDTETGEFLEKTLLHEGNAVGEFYAALEGPGLWASKPRERCSSFWNCWTRWGSSVG